MTFKYLTSMNLLTLFSSKMKIINFLREAKPIKIILISFLIGLPVIFIEESFPTIFIFLRLFSFALIMYAIIKLFFKD